MCLEGQSLVNKTLDKDFEICILGMKFRSYKCKYEMKVVYIDAQNIHKGTKELGWTIDWRLFFDYLHTKFTPDYIKIFFGYIKTLESFYQNLQNIGYMVIFKQVMLKSDGTIKGNVDVDLTMSVMEDLHVGGLSLAYIVSGDGDFNTLVQRLAQEQKLGRLIVPVLLKTSSQLRHASGSNIQALSDLKHLLSKKETSN